MRWLFAGLLLSGCGRAEQPAAPPGETTVRLLALGDSFTIGTGSSPDEAFPARLAALFRERGCRVELRNIAVNGYATRDVIERELPEVDAFAPTWITFAAGANDIVRGAPEATYRENVRTILAAATRAVRPDHVIVLPQPKWHRTRTGALFGSADALEKKVTAFDTILRAEALAAHARFIDLAPLMERQASAEMVAADGLHPNAPAHAEWAREIQASLGPRPRCE